MSLQDVPHLLGEVLDGDMCHSEEGREGFEDHVLSDDFTSNRGLSLGSLFSLDFQLGHIFAEVNIGDIIVSDFDQGLLGPWHVPHDGGVIHETGVHSGIVTKVVSGLAHQDHKMEVVHHSGEEHFVEFVLGYTRHLLSFGKRLLHLTGPLLLHRFSDSWQVLLGVEQVGDFTHGKDVVDVLHKRLVYDLVITEKEDAGFRFETRDQTPPFDIFSEFFQSVILGYFDLPEFVAGDERGELGEGVTTGSSFSHEKTVSLSKFDDTMDLADILDGVLEQDDIHGLGPEFVVVIS